MELLTLTYTIMNINQAIMAAREIDKQQQEVISALADYATEHPTGLSTTLQVSENQIALFKQGILAGFVSLSAYVLDILTELLTPEEKRLIDWLDSKGMTIGHDGCGYYVVENDATKISNICTHRTYNGLKGILSIISHKLPLGEIYRLLDEDNNVNVDKVITYLSAR